MFYCVAETDDGYLFTGQTRSFGPGYINVYAVRTDYNGDTIWTRTYGGNVAQNCYSLHRKNDGNYVLCGYSSSFSAQNDVYMLEIDPDGNLIWQKSWGVAEADEYMYGCRPTSDGGYIVTGWTNYYFSLDQELFVLKLGPSSSTVKEPHECEVKLNIYPNPVHNRATIHLDVPGQKCITLQIVNALGQPVQTLIHNKTIQGKMEITWDTASLPVGLYFCKLITQEGIRVDKLIKSNNIAL